MKKNRFMACNQIHMVLIYLHVVRAKQIGSDNFGDDCRCLNYIVFKTATN